MGAISAHGWGCRPDFSNGLGGDSNSGPILGPQRLFEPDSNNDPSPGHSNLVSDEVYICLSLLLMISWWLPYLAKGPAPDFNNGPGNDLNSEVVNKLDAALGQLHLHDRNVLVV